MIIYPKGINMRFVKFSLLLWISIVAEGGDLRVLSIGVEPDLLARGKFDIYAQDAVFVARAFEKTAVLNQPVKIEIMKGANAMRTKILNRISEIAKELKPDDTTIIFFSSHGDLNKNGSFYFSMAPENTQNTWGRMTGKDFNDALKELKGKVLVLLDTCEAEGIIKERVSDNISYIVASKINESSYGQEANKAIPHGYFVISLCEALSGLADENKDKKVSLIEFYNYISKRSCALEPSQTACSHLRPSHKKLVLSRIRSNTRPTFILDEIKSRNPFGCKDVIDPRHGSVKDFLKSVNLTVNQKDENAKEWNKKKLKKSQSITGEWESRWKSTGDDWAMGNAWIKVVGRRTFILFKGVNSNYIFELKTLGKNKLSGRYLNLNDESDCGPWAGIRVSDDRIDGFWQAGRWDFRRKTQ